MTYAVGLSGGVDSTTTALLLQEQKHTVVGATMKLFSDKFPEITGGCFSCSHQRDIEEVAKFCKRFDIPHYVIDVSKEFEDMVISYVIESYQKGETPNPCMICNARIKFGVFIKKLQAEVSFDRFATGHYASIFAGSLFASTSKKDQSYFLALAAKENEDIFKKVEFPLSRFDKSAVRAIAAHYDLSVADKEDSQDFAGGRIDILLDGKLPPRPFLFRGSEIGKPSTLPFTIGQRHHLPPHSLGPLYVKKITSSHIEVDTYEGCLKSSVSSRNFLEFYYPGAVIHSIKIRSSSGYLEVKDSPFIALLKKPSTFFLTEPRIDISPGQFIVAYDYLRRVVGVGEISAEET